MRRSVLTLLLCVPAGAQAQYPPEVEVVPLIPEKRPHLLASQVAVADCYTSLPGGQREELAQIGVTLRGSWARSARHLACEKAAELGANCLQVLSSSGEDGKSYPVIRRYKAFRVTVPYGPWRVPASVQSLNSASAAAAGAPLPTLGRMPVLKAPVVKRKTPEPHGDHLSRAMGEAVYFHEVVLEPSALGPELREDLLQDAREYFGDAEHGRLLRLLGEGRPVRVDLRSGRISG